LDRKRFEATVASDRRGGEKESRRPGFAYPPSLLGFAGLPGSGSAYAETSAIARSFRLR